MKIKFVIITIATAGLVAACNRGEPAPAVPQTADQAKAAAEAAKDSVAKTKDEFLASMDKQMAEFDAKINRLADKSANATGDAKVRADQALNDLRAQRDAVRKQYDQLKVSGQDVWEKTKSDFQSAWDSLVKAYDNASAKLTSP